MPSRNTTLLSRIKVQNVYLDRKSKEKSTGKIKPKYKLAGNSILNLYTFFVVHSSNSALRNVSTMIINQSDWENKNYYHLLKSHSFIDINNEKHITILKRKDLLMKIRDHQNRFPYVARMSDSKFKELREFRERIRNKFRPIGIAFNKTIDLAVAEDVEKAYEKLFLK